MNSSVTERDAQKMLRIGLVINPVAGIGGPAGLKGSDSPLSSELAQARGVDRKAARRVVEMLDDLGEHVAQLKIITASGEMGGDSCLNAAHDVAFELVYACSEHTSARDTTAAVQAIVGAGVDLLLFAGGDGTARDVCQAVDSQQLVLGIPAGVKMHSGVFAVTPRAVSSVIKSILAGRLVAVRQAEVRDIDEAAFAQDKVRTRHYGEMLIPDDQLLVQTVKCSGLPDDELMLEELSEFLISEMDDSTLYVLGSGGTLHYLKQKLGMPNPTLLGVDVWFQGQVIAKDVYEAQLYDLLEQYEQVALFISIIGGQGVVLGRGNQQLSPRVIERIGIENIRFLATQQKILALDGAPLRVDSGSDELDKKLSGYHPVICGYEDSVLYEVRYLD